MYITVKSIKRDLGFKGIEISDIVIALPMIILFIVLFCFTPLKIPAIVGLMIGIFCLLPINVSKKNRMYKVIGLIFKFLFREKIFVYQKERQVNKIEETTS
jgi:nicotinamide riboside transporter PnuC